MEVRLRWCWAAFPAIINGSSRNEALRGNQHRLGPLRHYIAGAWILNASQAYDSNQHHSAQPSYSNKPLSATILYAIHCRIDLKKLNLRSFGNGSPFYRDVFVHVTTPTMKLNNVVILVFK